MGRVVNAMAMEDSVSQQLRLNMILWYTVDSLLGERSMMEMISSDDTADRLLADTKMAWAWPDRFMKCVSMFVCE